MGTHLHDSFNSLDRILEGHQELSKEVLKPFGGHVEFNRCKNLYKNRNEPRREKTGLRDFRPGPTQTGLYKLRSRLEA